jgi:ABC-2 type transport system ATP-binding protein
MSVQAPLAIEADGLVKSFGDTRAVDGVDLAVPRGAVYGVLGPNGAGKTTTIRMLATLLRPDAGSARVLGHDIVSDADAVRGLVSLTGQLASVDEDLTGRENLILLGRLLGYSRSRSKERAAELLDAFGLADAASRQVKHYSGGMRRRLDLAAGLVGRPSVIFLDEPTTGLDPQARANLWTHIADLRRRRGATVFLTTHYLDEADALSDRIIVIDHGRIIAADTSDNLKAHVSGDLVDLEIVDPDLVAEAAKRLDAIAEAGHDGAGSVETDGNHVRARVQRAGKAVPGLLSDLRAADIDLESIEVHRPTLDDVFLTLTGRSLRDAEASAPVDPTSKEK